MAFSLYDASVANYLQILGGVSGFLERGLTYFREQSIDPETIVYNHLNQPRELVKAKAVTKLFG